jgi:hypothetical protein
MDRGRIIWFVLFSIAMGFLETAVVVYLRFLYYPGGFAFPLVIMDTNVAVIELLREAATIIMLIGIGYMAGHTFTQRFGFFILCFAIWDICYYIFLKLLLNWPESLLTWDILFLIPVPWIGPVLAPCLVSLTMVLLGVIIYHRSIRKQEHQIKWPEWFLLTIGSLVIIGSWTKDYLAYSSQTADEENPLFAFSTFVPGEYNWYLFGLGELIILAAVFIYWKRTGT